MYHLFCSFIWAPGLLARCIGHTISAATRRPRGKRVTAPNFAHDLRVEAESREVKDGVNGVACRVTKYEKRTLVQVGTEAATRYTFDLKSASWQDDQAVRKQARAHKKWAGLAPARASSSSEAASAASDGGSDDGQRRKYQHSAVRQRCLYAGRSGSSRCLTSCSLATTGGSR